MAWAVYRNSDNLVVSGHPDGVTAMAAKVALGNAYTVVRVNDNAGVEAELPDLYRPNAFWIVNGVIQNTPTNTTMQLKQAALAQRQRICDLFQALREEEEFYPQTDVTLAQTFLSYLHWGARAVFLSTTLTAAQKLAWVQASALGPSDLNSGTAALTIDQARNFFPIVHQWTEVQQYNRLPRGAVLTCTPASGNERFTLASMWTGSQALTGLAEDPTEMAEIRKIASGTWIDEITA